MRAVRSVAAVAVALIAGCGGEPPANSRDSAPVRLERSSYAIVDVKSLRSGPALSGTIVPRVRAVLRAEVSGSVLGAYALPGEEVEKGELLVRLENSDLEQSVRSSQVAVNDAKTRLNLAERQERRQRALFEAGAVSRRELEQAEENRSTAASSLAQAETNLAQARKELDSTRVVAPFAGRISDKSVSQGDVVQVGTALYTLVDLASNELVAFLPPGEAGDVRIGTPVSLRVIGQERRMEGTVARINPSTDPTTRQARIYVSLGSESENLPAGLFAEGRVLVDRVTSLAIPESAVEREGDTATASVVREGTVEHVEVALGVQDSVRGLVEVRSGLMRGDRVLLGAARSLTGGVRVQLAQLTAVEESVARPSVARP